MTNGCGAWQKWGLSPHLPNRSFLPRAARVEVLIFQAYDKHLEQLTEVAERVCRALDAAGISYRIIGGLAVFFHVQAKDPIAARLTKDVDLAIDRRDLERVAHTVRSLGLEYRHVAGVDMLVDASRPSARSAIHMIFVREKVRPDYIEPVPDFSSPVIAGGISLAPVPDVLRMKLTSLRLKDKVHIIDMDGVGLITPEIEAALPDPLRRRLQQVRDEERQSAGAE